MLKRLLVAAFALALLVSLSGCRVFEDNAKICEPYSVRQDTYNPKRWWLCNSDGTYEKPIRGPEPARDPTQI